MHFLSTWKEEKRPKTIRKGARQRGAEAPAVFDVRNDAPAQPLGEVLHDQRLKLCPGSVVTRVRMLRNTPSSPLRIHPRGGFVLHRL
jgi:hypothetical protein